MNDGPSGIGVQLCKKAVRAAVERAPHLFSHRAAPGICEAFDDYDHTDGAVRERAFARRECEKTPDALGPIWFFPEVIAEQPQRPRRVQAPEFCQHECGEHV